MSRRVTLAPYEIDGKTIEPGSILMTCLGSANRDPAEVGPDRRSSSTCVDADAREHMAFGGGFHSCLGAHLARLEGGVAIATLVRRFPNIELATDELEWNGRIVFRGLNRLPVAPGAIELEDAAEVPERAHVHRERDRDVERDAEPDRLRLQRQRAEHDAADDRGQRFGHRLAVVEHVVRHDHREDRGPAEARHQPVQHEAAEEELERCELQPVQRPPHIQVRPQASARPAGGRRDSFSWNAPPNDAATISGAAIVNTTRYTRAWWPTPPHRSP